LLISLDPLRTASNFRANRRKQGWLRLRVLVQIIASQGACRYETSCLPPQAGLIAAAERCKPVVKSQIQIRQYLVPKRREMARPV
jgi:hypothetical protein